MPLDTSIPLQVGQGIQVPAINPMALYQAAQERQYNALRGQALQQEMQKNALAMKYLQENRATEQANALRAAQERAQLKSILSNALSPAAMGARGAGYSGTGVSTDAYSGLIPKLVEGGFLSQAGDIAELGNKQATGRKTAAETQGVLTENQKKQTEANIARFGEYGDAVLRAGTPEEVYSLIDSHADVLKNLGISTDQAKKNFADLAARTGFENAQMTSAKGAMATQKHFSDMLVAQKPELKNIAGMGMVAVNPYNATGKRVTVDGEPLPTNASEVPELKKGEVWNAEKQRVDAAKGSDIYIVQSQKHGKDLEAAKSLTAANKAVDEKIKEILAPENEDAFNNNFGGSTYLGTRYIPGKTQTIAGKIESLKSDMKSAGLALMKSRGGAIGTITEREWPYLEQMIDSIKPEMPENDARRIIQSVGNRIAELNNIAKETYDETWGNTQYYKPNAIGGATSNAASAATNSDAGGEFEGFILRK